MLPAIEQAHAAARVSLPKRVLCVLLTAALAATMTVLPSTQSKAYAAEDVSITVAYEQTDARAMLAKINEFRASNPTCWNSDNKTQTTYSGLSALAYDYSLEQVAMLRAAEIAYQGKDYYSHTRPNGENYETASWHLPLTSRSENIAWGTGTLGTMDSIFEGWREDDKYYAGQMHRRIMADAGLGAVGIAHVKYQGVDYWVQSFGSHAVNTTPTVAVDTEQTVIIPMTKTPAPAKPSPDASQTSKPAVTTTGSNASGNSSKPAATTPKKAKLTKLKVKGGKKKLVIKWTVSGAEIAGYQIKYSTSKKFAKKKTKTATVTQSIAAKTRFTHMQYKLKAKKTYYVKVRAWQNVKGKNGKYKKQYTKWSAKKKITTK